MRLPYMRFAVYALTFLTYAYSGYGSSVIATLRDAIIAAEAVFGDVFQNLIYVAKKFKVVHDVFDAAVEENCFYKCPGGEWIVVIGVVTFYHIFIACTHFQIGGMPSRNKYYVPSADGCGSLGLKINTEYLPATEMASCCNEHDICYDTCNKDKELCDLDFKRCLYNYCDTYEKTAVGGDLVVKGKQRAKPYIFL